MSKRITVQIDEKLFKKLKSIQAKMIRDSDRTVSFSAVVNQILLQDFKK